MLIGKASGKNSFGRFDVVLLVPSCLGRMIIVVSLEGQKTQSIMKSLPLPLGRTPLKTVSHLI